MAWRRLSPSANLAALRSRLRRACFWAGDSAVAAPVAEADRSAMVGRQKAHTGVGADAWASRAWCSSMCGVRCAVCKLTIFARGLSANSRSYTCV
jgi:hypothetical protein